MDLSKAFGSSSSLDGPLIHLTRSFIPFDMILNDQRPTDAEHRGPLFDHDSAAHIDAWTLDPHPPESEKIKLVK